MTLPAECIGTRALIPPLVLLKPAHYLTLNYEHALAAAYLHYRQHICLSQHSHHALPVMPGSNHTHNGHLVVTAMLMKSPKLIKVDQIVFRHS